MLVLLEANAITVPPVGAGPFKVIVAVDGMPPTTEARERVRPLSPAGLIVRVAVFVNVPWMALIVTAVDAPTAEVTILKLAELAPAAMVTLDGGAAMELLDVRLTTAPSAGAGPFRVIVPVEGVHPTTDVGDKVKADTTAGVTVSVAEAVKFPTDAVIEAGVELETADVVIVKVADVFPAVTVTEAGRVALGLLDDRLTTSPPVGEGAPSVTVPVDEDPPVTEAGVIVTAFGAGGVISNVAWKEALPWLAVIVADTPVLVADVVMVKVAVVFPAATVTAGGGAALEELDAKLTTSPPFGAGPVKVTVPVEAAPPMTVEGETARLSKLDLVASLHTMPLPLAPPSCVVPHISPELSNATSANGTLPSEPLIPFASVMVPPKSCKSLYVPEAVISHAMPPLNRSPFEPPKSVVPYRSAPSSLMPAAGNAPSIPLFPFALVTVPPKSCRSLYVPVDVISQTMPVPPFEPPWPVVPYILPLLSNVTPP